MVCPACGYQWDTQRDACQRCGFRGPTAARFAPAAGAEEVRSGMTRPGNISHIGAADLFSAQKSSCEPLSSAQGPAGSTSLPGSADQFQARSSSGAASSLLKPGTLLRQKRYRLQDLLTRQPWNSGVCEALWVGRDLQHQKQVKICEVIIPDELHVQTLPIMQTATRSLLSVQHVPHLTPLLDAFSDQGHSFFVFELPAGETLSTRLRRLRHPFSEQSIVDFCLQMVSVLETFQQKAPPLVHGWICPERVSLSYDGSRYVLSDFPLLISGRATRLLSGLDRSHFSPYAAPECVQNVLDPRNDLYSVLATAYYLATGSVPARGDSAPARSLNPTLTPGLEAILTRGLHPQPDRRYQQPSQLYQDLFQLSSQATRTASGGLSPQAEQSLPLSKSGSLSFVPAPALSSPLLHVDEETDVLLPAPETLPPLRMGYERLEAAVILLIILGSLSAIVSLSHFHV